MVCLICDCSHSQAYLRGSKLHKQLLGNNPDTCSVEMQARSSVNTSCVFFEETHASFFQKQNYSFLEFISVCGACRECSNKTCYHWCNLGIHSRIALSLWFIKYVCSVTSAEMVQKAAGIEQLC